MNFAFVVAIGLTASVAAADPSLTKSSNVSNIIDGHAVGLAVNEPVGWVQADAVGASAYIALDKHQVLRANFATWTNEYGLGKGAATAWLADPVSSRQYAGGRFTDGGVSWMYFPRKAYDGLSLELGALVRHADVYNVDDFNQNHAEVSNYYALRAMIGWSWLIRERVFISVQGGVSAGILRGQDVATDTEEPQMMYPATVTKLDESHQELEGMVRFGVLL